MPSKARVRNQALTRRDFMAGAFGAVAGGALPSTSTAPVYAAFVKSPVACGLLRKLDLSPGRALPEVLAALQVATGDTLDYVGQPLALFVATRAEAAVEAARRCVLLHESRPATLTTAAALPGAYVGSEAAAWNLERGNAEAAIVETTARLGAQAILLRQTYRTAPEPIGNTPPAQHLELLALAERTVRRPVSLALPEEPALRPETIQTLTLQAGRDGRLRALVQNVLNDTAMRAEYVEPCASVSPHLYHVDNLQLSHKLVRKNIAPRGGAHVLGRGTLPGLFALEGALDELAQLLRIDPLRLRLLNHAEVDEATQKPWADKRLRECYRVGAERIDWASRKLEPRAQRQGALSIGLGMASTMSPPLRHGEAMAALFGAHFTRLGVETESKEVSAARVLRHVTVLDAAPAPRLLEAAKDGISQALRTLFSDGNKAVAGAEIDVVLLEPGASSISAAAPKIVDAQLLRDVAASGVAAAVASALYNASGVRYRELPIRLLQVVG